MNAPNMPDIQNQGRMSVIRFSGFVDAATAEGARRMIAAKIPADCSDIIIDLGKVDFLDSHGVGMFVSLLKRVHQKGGRLFFVSATGQPASVLNIVGFNDKLVTYCDSIQQAQELRRER